MVRYTCNNCGFSSLETDLTNEVSICPNCDGHFIEVKSLSKAEEADLQQDSSITASESRRLRLEFTGSAGEYFRIWIVNTFLTLVTLGIYAAWAKVRNRQYFYRNTLMDGHPFDYTADPKSILRGHLIIAAGFGLYNLASTYNHILSLALAGLISLAFPLLIYKSLRFFAHNSTFRNIRFRFLGTLRDSYNTYLLIPALAPLTLGLIVPYWFFRKKKYFFDNIAYGVTGNTFSGKPWPFYKAYGSAFIAGVLFFIAGIFVTILFFPAIKDALHFDKGPVSPVASLIPLVMIALVLPVSIFIQQELYAWTTNYCWGHSNPGRVRLQSTLKGTRLFWISITNILLMFCSLGLLAPWAKVRRTRYILDNLTVIAGHDFDDFTAAASHDDSSVGEAATDFFDIDIGL